LGGLPEKKKVLSRAAQVHVWANVWKKRSCWWNVWRRHKLLAKLWGGDGVQAGASKKGLKMIECGSLVGTSGEKKKGLGKAGGQGAQEKQIRNESVYHAEGGGT